MVKRLALICSLLIFFVSSFVSPFASSQALPQPHPYELLRALERFDKDSILPANNEDLAANTELSIKGVKIGDNILRQAINLEKKGGELGRIRGGTRSDKLKFSFYQPYENTRLEQRIELYFDKYNGFIQHITATYTLQDAYLSIVPIRQQTLRAAVEKFGSPLTMQQAADLSGQLKAEIGLERFINGLQNKTPIHPLALEYFEKHSISRSAKWVAGEQGYALMHTGFDRCYMWQTNAFKQILTFCFFDKTGANQNSRGVEFKLHNFPIDQQITELGNPHTKPDISL